MADNNGDIAVFVSPEWTFSLRSFSILAESGHYYGTLRGYVFTHAPGDGSAWKQHTITIEVEYEVTEADLAPGGKWRKSGGRSNSTYRVGERVSRYWSREAVDADMRVVFAKIQAEFPEAFLVHYGTFRPMIGTPSDVDEPGCTTSGSYIYLSGLDVLNEDYAISHELHKRLGIEVTHA